MRGMIVTTNTCRLRYWAEFCEMEDGLLWVNLDGMLRPSVGEKVSLYNFEGMEADAEVYSVDSAGMTCAVVAWPA